jgi:hypothetical protein
VYEQEESGRAGGGRRLGAGDRRSDLPSVVFMEVGLLSETDQAVAAALLQAHVRICLLKRSKAQRQECVKRVLWSRSGCSVFNAVALLHGKHGAIAWSMHHQGCHITNVRACTGV